MVTRCLLLLLVVSAPVLAQRGKISGRVTESGTGTGLPGVSVVIEGTQVGAASDRDGYYTILNVRPGIYRVQFSSLGFAREIVEGVDVNTNQTTTVNAALREEGVGIDEVVVLAERPVVQPDVSNTLVNVQAAEIESLPRQSVEAVIALQPGIENSDDGPVVRGDGPGSVSFMVNGFMLRNERDNSPVVITPLSSVEEIQVQTGGFNAEYGNARSGIINVITKEGDPRRYEAAFRAEVSPPTQKHFGAPANDPNSFWIRPYVDPAVAFVGTANGTWDNATRSQYPGFEGWIAISEGLLADADPSNDMTPEALQQAFLYQHRKSFEATRPDTDYDIGFGGPFPGLRGKLGNLRFYASYRDVEQQYLIPLNTESYRDRMGHLKVTSDLARGMKLSVEGRLGTQNGTAASRSGTSGIFESPSSIAANLTTVSFIDARLFSNDYWNPTRVNYNQLAATFTHSLSDRTFYTVRLHRLAFDHRTTLGRARDTTKTVFFGGVGFDEAPFGFLEEPTFGVDGLRMSVGFSNARDTSRVTTYNMQFDFVSQLNRVMEVQTGFEYNRTNQDINYGRFDQFLPSSNAVFQWNEYPTRGAVYAQTKLEFKGMIANIGLRGDYFSAGGDSYAFDRFDPAFGSSEDPLAALDSLLGAEPVERQFTLSPRLGVSFPVSASSKLYFNYGHFRSMPDPSNIFLFGVETAAGRISSVPNPNNPLPKTVAYELGYEQSFFEQFLVRVAGYYKDISLEPRSVEYLSRNGEVNFFLSEPNTYADTRGFEVTLSRNRGKWLTGFVNYTYMVDTGGYFGLALLNENTTAQRLYEEDDAVRRAAQSRPVPRPYGRLNLRVLTPDDWGPRIGDFRPLGDWSLSFLGTWRDGGKVTWAGGGSKPGVLNNLDVRDPWFLDLQLARTFTLRQRALTFYVSVLNATNRRQFSSTGFFDGVDRDNYLNSLHLPASPDYNNLVGDDNFGTFRDDDVAYVPMRGIQNRLEVSAPDDEAIYFERETESYLVYQNGAWTAADPSRVDQVLRDKAYIDMPNQTFLTFLNPRQIYYGIRIRF